MKIKYYTITANRKDSHRGRDAIIYNFSNLY